MRLMHGFQARFRLSWRDTVPIFFLWMLHCSMHTASDDQSAEAWLGILPGHIRVFGSYVSQT